MSEPHSLCAKPERVRFGRSQTTRSGSLLTHKTGTITMATVALSREILMPKGYNDKAIDGLLTFLEGCFEVILQEIQNGKSPEEAMHEELEEIKTRLEDDKTSTSPSINFERSR
jgi:hypothetical protein